MKYLVLLGFTFAICISAAQAQTSAGTGYNIKITLKDSKAPEIYLGFTMADKKYLKDTAKVQKNGLYVFEGSEKLTGGVFFIYTPSKQFFEIMVDDNQFFSIETDTVNFVKNAKIKGSTVNSVFFDFVSKAGPLQAEMGELKKRISGLDKATQADSIELLNDKLIAKDDELRALQDKIINENPDLFFTKLLLGIREPEVPKELPLNADGTRDSSYILRYYKAHYWDNFDFNENKLAYSEIFQNKLKMYFGKLVPPIHDSLIAEADLFLAKTEKAPELQKFLINFLYTYGDTTKMLGGENLAVHIGNKYFITNEAPWIEAAQLKKIQEHIRSLEKVIIGKKAPNLRLADTTGVQFLNLHDVKAKYTVVVFWDPTCGHCQKDLPKLQTFYDEWKAKGVEIYSVYTQREIAEWKKFIKEKKLSFPNVAVHPDMAANPEKYIYELKLTDIESLNMHKTYYITSTPQIYLLDENKMIIGRRLSPEGLPKLIEAFEKQNSKKNKP